MKKVYVAHLKSSHVICILTTWLILPIYHTVANPTKTFMAIVGILKIKKYIHKIEFYWQA